MSRSLFVVLAILALLVAVSAQSSSSSSSASASVPSSSSTAASRPSSSSSSTFVRSLSSSSSYVAPNSSTGAWSYNISSSSSSSSSSGFPAGTYSISFEVVFGFQITTENVAAVAVTVQEDIVYNLAQLSGANNNTVSNSVVVTSINGTRTGNGPSRRLLQAAYPGGVTFILLGSIVNALPSFNPTTVVTQFVTAAATGQLVAKFTNATIPVQAIQASAVGAISSSSSSTGSSSSSTGYGDNNGASSVASAGVALLFAAVASLALLL